MYTCGDVIMTECQMGDLVGQCNRGSDEVKKRTDYLNWDEYFMAVAFLSAQRSKDPKSQVSNRLLLLLSFTMNTDSVIIGSVIIHRLVLV